MPIHSLMWHAASSIRMVYRRRRKALEQTQIPCTGSRTYGNNCLVDPPWVPFFATPVAQADTMPAPTKAAGPNSVGYDVYDLWDLGEFDQKGSKPTKYGTKHELKEMISTARENRIVTYIDAVLNHKFGADACEKFEASDRLGSSSYAGSHPPGHRS